MNKHTHEQKAREAGPEEDPMCPVPGVRPWCSLISALLFAVAKLSRCILEAHTTALFAESQCQ